MDICIPTPPFICSILLLTMEPLNPISPTIIHFSPYSLKYTRSSSVRLIQPADLCTLHFFGSLCGVGYRAPDQPPYFRIKEGSGWFCEVRDINYSDAGRV
jgi:hypothetical protein